MINKGVRNRCSMITILNASLERDRVAPPPPTYRRSSPHNKISQINITSFERDRVAQPPHQLLSLWSSLTTADTISNSVSKPDIKQYRRNAWSRIIHIVLQSLLASLYLKYWNTYQRGVDQIRILQLTTIERSIRSRTGIIFFCFPFFFAAIFYIHNPVCRVDNVDGIVAKPQRPAGALRMWGALLSMFASFRAILCGQQYSKETRRWFTRASTSTKTSNSSRLHQR